MYIEIHEWESFTQKQLYFKLNNAFNMNLLSEENHKIAGVYAIYKDDICLYVGQSKNCASRLATHLKGKYETATDIHIWDVNKIGFSDFYDRDIDTQKTILDNCEKWLMTKLKPIENLLIDMSFELEDSKTPNICFESNASVTIDMNEFDIKIFDESYYGVEEFIVSVDRLHYEGKITDSVRGIVTETIYSLEPECFYKKGLKYEY
jgi:hypothetical protein